jgi:hypothetical protein
MKKLDDESNSSYPETLLSFNILMQLYQPQLKLHKFLEKYQFVQKRCDH